MASKIETGHAKNIANFEDLVSFCTGFGAVYNPGNVQLQVASMQAKYAACNAELDAVMTAKNAYSDITNKRAQAFKDLIPFATKLINHLIAFGVHKETVLDARRLVRKMNGVKLSKADEVPGGTTLPPAGSKTISSSQKSYDSMLFNFMQLVDLVSGQPAYAPNEADFTVAGLQAKVVTLKGFVTGVTDAHTAIVNARIARNKGLYHPTTGLVSIALDCKAYIKAVFGASSPEYVKVVKLQFKYLTTL